MNPEQQPNYEDNLRRELSDEIRKGKDMLAAQNTALSLAGDNAKDATQLALILAEVKRVNEGLKNLLHSKIH